MHDRAWGGSDDDTIAEVDRDTGRLIVCRYSSSPWCLYQRGEDMTDQVAAQEPAQEAAAPSGWDRLGGRKLAFSVFVVLGVFLLRAFGKLGDDVVLYVCCTALVGYPASNVFQKVAGSKS